jgi:hypothetical protein
MIAVVGWCLFWFLCGFVLECMCEVGDRLAIQGLFLRSVYLEVVYFVQVCLNECVITDTLMASSLWGKLER